MLVLWVVMEKTRLGATVRATVDDAQMARGVGIDTSFISMLIFAIGAFLAEQRPDLILMDIQLPIMDGYTGHARKFVSTFPRQCGRIRLTGTMEYRPPGE